MQPNILVTGASGFLGWHVCRIAAASRRVFGTYHDHPVQIDGVVCRRIDISDPGSLQSLFEQLQPDAVIHTAAVSQANVCQNQPGETWRINVGASAAIAGLCAERGIPCVFTSTDLLFDGNSAPYAEDDPPSPLSVYGEQKAAAEAAMRERYPQTAICRMPLMFGDTGGARRSFDMQMVRSLLAGRRVTLFYDEFRTPVDAESAARGLLRCVEEGVEGTIHLGGKERLSRYEMGVVAAKAFGADLSLIDRVSQTEVPMSAPRPADVSLDSARAFSMGYDPADVVTAYRRIADRRRSSSADG